VCVCVTENFLVCIKRFKVQLLSQLQNEGEYNKQWDINKYINIYNTSKKNNDNKSEF